MKRIQPRIFIECACGCGAIFENKDNKNRYRRFKWGHHSQEFKEKLRKSNLGRESPRKGKHHTLETRLKMSMSHTGKSLPLETKKRMSESNARINLGKHLSEETKKKISDKLKGGCPSKETRIKCGIKARERWTNPEYKNNISIKHKARWSNPEYRERVSLAIRRGAKRGDKASAWRGGLSFIPYTQEFNKQLKNIVRNRDNHKCQLCGMPEIENCKALTVHHIDYDKANSSQDNLISLCVSCNTKVNNNRDYWLVYFRELLQSKQNALAFVHEMRERVNEDSSGYPLLQ